VWSVEVLGVEVAKKSHCTAADVVFDVVFVVVVML
jgi:hypothetical protein